MPALVYLSGRRALALVALLSSVTMLGPWTPQASAQASPTPAPQASQAQASQALTWQTLPQIAAAVYARGPGLAAAAQQRANRAERARQPGRWQSVWLGGQLELPLRQEQRPAEHGVLVGASIALGDWPQRQRAVLDALLGEHRAASAHERWRFIAHVAQVYAQWWGASALMAHVERDLQTLERDLALYQEAGRAALSPLDLAEARVMLGRLRVERAALERERAGAEAALAAALGLGPDQEGLTLSAAQAPSLEALEPDPWAALLGQEGRHPEVLSAQAQRLTLLERADAAASFTPWTLQLQGQLLAAGASDVWWMQTASLVIPLANPGPAEAARQRLEAQGAQAQAQWAAQQLRAQWRSSSAQHRAARQALEVAHRELILPLEARQRLLDEAARAGHLPAMRALIARVELHEAEHEHLAARLALGITQRHAQLIALMLLDVSPRGPQ